MPSPPITVFLTTIASQPALRQRQEYLLRILQVKKIPFTSYDLASDEEAKRLWKRKAPLDKQQIPGILVGGRFPGTFSDFEEAVEYGELDTFLRLKETWNPNDDDRPPPPPKPVGVPGAAMPLQMTPEHLRKKIIAEQSSPLRGKNVGIPVNKRVGAFDAGTAFSGYGLQGVKVTEDELKDLVAALGLDGDEAGDLVKGLSYNASPKEEKEINNVEKGADVKEVPEPERLKAKDEGKVADTAKEEKAEGSKGKEAEIRKSTEAEKQQS